jgi:hypothetical protein
MIFSYYMNETRKMKKLLSVCVQQVVYKFQVLVFGWLLVVVDGRGLQLSGRGSCSPCLWLSTLKVKMETTDERSRSSNNSHFVLSTNCQRYEWRTDEPMRWLIVRKILIKLNLNFLNNAWLRFFFLLGALHLKSPYVYISLILISSNNLCLNRLLLNCTCLTIGLLEEYRNNNKVNSQN